jgi:predicted RND superfamily exporter protein
MTGEEHFFWSIGVAVVFVFAVLLLLSLALRVFDWFRKP